MKVVIAGQQREAEQGESRNRITRWGRVVEPFLRTNDELLMAVAGEEKSAGFVIPKLLDHFFAEARSIFDPFNLAGCFVEGNQTVNQASIVFEIAIQLRFAIFICPQQQPV